MKLFHIALFAFLAACAASTAQAQYGLYGAPEMLAVGQPNQPQNYPPPAGYPTLAAANTVYQPNQTYQPGQSYQPPANSSYQPYQPPANPSGQSPAGQGCQAGCGGGPCGQSGPCLAACSSPWYASVLGLVMGRTDGRRIWTSYATDLETEQLANSQFQHSWEWGGEVRFGRRFCCGCTPFALEATYWTITPFSGFEEVTNPGNFVSTPLNVSQVTFHGVTADNWFENAESHRLWRRDEFHDIEINLIREQMTGPYDSPWDIGWSVGVRYFRFHDFFQFASVAVNHHWGEPASEAYLSDDITNNLIGPQFGFDAAYNLFPNVRLFITPKVGIYDNYMDHTFQARLGDGTNGSGVYGDFPVNSTRHGLSFLTQIDLGADWRFAQNWSARLGYRVVAITGIGTADDQFPQYIVDKPEIANIQNCSSLVLHGAFLGVTYNF
jgi:hypothetical protein